MPAFNAVKVALPAIGRRPLRPKDADAPPCLIDAVKATMPAFNAVKVAFTAAG
ncbi:hypothetical protein [Prauserella flavalba]|uniref:hypothetical protein n=1 Tax=Prauserella flavalba TaxID=1477506 RepID=UPI0036F070C8